LGIRSVDGSCHHLFNRNIIKKTETYNIGIADSFSDGISNSSIFGILCKVDGALFGAIPDRVQHVTLRRRWEI
jgi:hypothetical protein